MAKERRIQDIYGLSPMQSGMLFHSIVNKDAGAYFEQTVFPLSGRIDPLLLEESFARVIRRHDILRTVFRFEKVKQPLQFVLKDRKFNLHFEDISGKAHDESESYIDDYMRRDVERGFDLAKDLLTRVALFKTGEDRFRLIWSYHHIIMDGWCRSLIFIDLIRIYTALRNGRDIELPPTIPYKKYIQWIERRDKDRGFNYWRDYLDGYEKKTGLPGAWKSEVESTYKLKIHRSVIETPVVTGLNKVAAANKTTVNILFQTVWGLLLQAYNNTGDAVFGAVVSGRPAEIEGVEEMVGLFINTIPVRIKTGDVKDVGSLLETVRRKSLESKPYEYLPLAEVQANSPLKGNLMDHILAFENYPMDDAVKEAGDGDGLGFTIEGVENIEKISYDFYISIYPGETFRVDFSYNAGLYSDDAVEAAARHFCNMLAQVAKSADNPAIKIAGIDILTGSEKEQLLVDLCAVDAGYPADKTLHRLFEDRAAKTPGNSAVVFDGERLSYDGLNTRAGSLSGVLSEKGVVPGTIVGILAHRSMEMVVAVLAVLKAGGGYLPIDPTFPRERIAYMLEDSGLDILLTDNTEETANIAKTARTVDLKDPDVYTGYTAGSKHAAAPRDLAYIIYTSGTTGNPKGVMIEHRNVVRLLFNDKFQFDFGSADTWTLFHSYCFDFSVWEMYGALLYGGKLIVIPKMTARDPGRFLGILKDEGVTVLNQTPSAFYNLIDEELKHNTRDLKLRYVIFGGEALKPGKLDRWREMYPKTTLVNMFGITETTVHVTYKEITESEIQRGISNIGGPIPTLGAYILDKYHRLLPPGVPGELCVGGSGVARGYLNKPRLTAEKFIDNPYKHGERLYLSGDLARLTPGGDMEYMGRIDRQVQIRGFRVELGEIENRLLAHKEITGAVVTDRLDENGEIFLCGYIVAARWLTVPELREYLSEPLPDYMIPTYFEHLDRVPLTANGKVDVNALPVPGVAAGGSHVGPRNESERRVADIWKQLLQLDDIGVYDSFFNVGGDSIKAIRLISSVNSELNAHLTIEDLYQNDTVEELSRTLDRGGEPDFRHLMEAAAREIDELKKRVTETGDLPGDIVDLYPMSDIEKGMVFLSSLRPEEAIYHDQNVYQVKYRDFDARVLKRAVELITEKHPILRTTFNLYDFEEPVQIVRENVSVDTDHLDFSHLNKSEQEESIKKFLEEDRARPFDLNLPLWRLATFALGGEDLLVVFVCHHSILDGWSVASFSTELNNTYLKLKEDPDFVPGSLKSTYKDFVIEQAAQKRREDAAASWKRELMNYKRLDIGGIKETGLRGKGTETYSRALGAPLSERLKGAARQYGSGVKNLCFGAYMYLMSMLSHDNDVTAGLVTNNRPTLEDGDKILGCFLNSVPVRFVIPSHVECRDYMGTVEKKILELKKYDRLPLFEIAKIIGEKPDEKNPIFDTLFNYTDFFIYGQAEAGAGSAGSTGESERPAVESYAESNTLFDLNIDNTSGLLWVILKVDRSLISRETAERISGYYTAILEKLAGDPGGIMSKDGMMGESERHRLLEHFNTTRTPYPGHRTIHGLFEDQADKTPDAVAAVFEDNRLTYRGLNQRSNRLARELRNRGVETGDIVGIMCRRSMETAVSIMAVLKAGGVYLPVDPSYPGERIKFMLKDTGVRTLLFTGVTGVTGVTGGPLVPDFAGPVIDLEDQSLYALSPGEENRNGPAVPSDSFAYVIYTSGTTGRPKGVAIRHKSAVNTLACRKSLYRPEPGDAAFQWFSYAFDGFVTSFFTPLISGAAVILPGEDALTDIGKIKEIILKNKATHFIVVPPLYRTLIEYLDPGELASLKVVTLAGDRITPDILEMTEKKNADIEISGEYGVTEASVMSTMYRNMKGGDFAVIGSPTWNTSILILDKSNGLQPMGIPGELCISGVGLAAGYLNRPELTAERFVRDPFHPGQKIYKTGDLARWLPDGNIEFLGRFDHQVKIRGFRVEPGEIEARLTAFDGIEEALVLVMDRGFLCAYIVSTGESTFPDAAELKAFLSLELPDYMIPLHFVEIENIPLTPNGKVDRAALPPPVPRETGSVAPETGVEKIIADTWKDVLKLDHVGVNDNLFELGGNSLDVMKITYLLKQEFGKDVPAVTMFKYPTVGLLAEYFNREEIGERVLEEQTVLPEARFKGKDRLEMMKRKRRRM